jgi:aspartate aminotransferase
MKLAARTEDVPASATIAVTTKAAALKAEGKDVIGFGAGQPDFDTPAHIISAAKKALDDGWTRYTPTAGLPQMKHAIQSHVARDFDLNVELNQVMVSCGAKHVLYNALQCLLNPGEEVILPAPYWVTYPVQCVMAGGRAQIVNSSSENGFVPRLSDLEAACNERTRGIIVNSPSNPSGAGYSMTDLEGIAQLARDRDLWVISDEIYAKLTYDGYTSRFFATLPGMAERTLTVYGLSKTYAMTGWRIGIGIGPAPLIAAMSRMQGQVTTNPAAPCQGGAIAALTEPEDFLPGWLAEFDQRRRIMVDTLNAMDGVTCNLPKGAFYAFPDLRGVLGRRAGDRVIDTDWALIDYLLEDAGIALVPGTPFGAPGFARLSYATSMANIEAGLARMGEALARLR